MRMVTFYETERGLAQIERETVRGELVAMRFKPGLTDEEYDRIVKEAAAYGP